VRTLARLLPYLKRYLAWVVLGSLLLAAGGALMAAVGASFKPLVNQLLLGEQSSAGAGTDILETLRRHAPPDLVERWGPAFVQVPLLIILIFFARGVLLYFGQYLTLKAGIHVIRDLRVELYKAGAHQSLAFFQVHPTGVILSRILNDVARLQRMCTTVLIDLVRIVAMAPFLIATAIYHDWRIAIVAGVALPLLGYPMLRLGRRLRRTSTVSQESMALVATRLTESVGGVQVVQSFGMEQFEVERFTTAVDRMLRADLRAGRALSLSPAVMELVGASVGAVLFLLAGVGIARGSLDPGNFSVVLFCLGLLFTSFRRGSSLYAETQQSLAAADRVFEMLDREHSIRDLPSARDLPPFARGIRFEDVCFSYGDERVLDRLDLSIAKGEIVALVGPSGAGKSTLANLLPRFYDPTGGRILVDGVALRDVRLASLRRQIGLVTQEAILFDDTVRANIAYGLPDTPQEQVISAARTAHAHEFIERLPQGYGTVLGERGTRLSMGQRQRITIARALLKSPPILILDEATSALDAESEALVQEALDRLMTGRTAIVIAHRLSTVRRADRIIVLDRGRIVEQGTHERLLRAGGLYSRLHALQFEDQQP
jgi:subfamily B ATP-binding cassette protein MsbA